MVLKDLLLRNRSYRRYYQDIKISRQELTDLVELTRWCSSGRNAQPLKYCLVDDEKVCGEVFETLSWAGYLFDWDGPEEGERPTAYLIQLLDTEIAENCLCDDGLQAQAILLGAVEKNYGGCMIKAFKNDKLRSILNLPDALKIMYVIALGKPKEVIVLDDMSSGGSYKYWREPDGTHHVPKRKIDELIYKLDAGF